MNNAMKTIKTIASSFFKKRRDNKIITIANIMNFNGISVIVLKSK